MSVDRLPRGHGHVSADAPTLPGPATSAGPDGTVDETNNAAVAAGAAMARAVLAAEHFRQTAQLPRWAWTPREDQNHG